MLEMWFLDGSYSAYTRPGKYDIVKEIREPRTFYTKEYKNGVLGRISQVRQDCLVYSDGKVIKLVEVLED